MKLVINIPDAIKEMADEDDKRLMHFMWMLILIDAIKNGVVLPKGHGRLGDLDALQKEVSSWGMNDYEPSDFIDEINNADTIIEADKEK